MNENRPISENAPEGVWRYLLVELERSPRPSSRNEGPASKGRRGRERKGKEGEERRGKRRERKGMGGRRREGGRIRGGKDEREGGKGNCLGYISLDAKTPCF